MTRADASAARRQARHEFRERVANAMGNVLVGYDPGTDEIVVPLPPRVKRALPGVWSLEHWQQDGGVWVVQCWRDGVWFGTGRGLLLARAVSAARKCARHFMFDHDLRGAP